MGHVERRPGRQRGGQGAVAQPDLWACPESACVAKTWTEKSKLAGARRVLTKRAEVWATVGQVDGTPANPVSNRGR